MPSEEACVGYAGGVRAAGGMPAVLCQSSGIGNALNALASLTVPYGLGFPLVVSMRGGLGEGNPAQTLLGKRVGALLESLGVQVFSLADPAHVARVVDGAVALASGARDVVAILLEPELDLT
jgi:sulfopyruvate decarboxylase TPP-binding subunit